MELPGEIYGTNLDEFAQVFCEILEVLSENDPKQRNCMKRKYIDRASWSFEFSNMDFFISTFLPCYAQTNSRYAHGAKDCYVLFQPKVSFALHDLPDETTETNWDEPQTIRDKIRVDFKKAGRPYVLKKNMPISHEMIKPLHENDDTVSWWRFKKTNE